jgi:predicted heme/steroid binding protein
MAMAIGADLKDIREVQVHPTGLVHPDEPDAKLKFLAAEALRGVGGIMIDGNGKRFCNELGRRDYVSEEMVKGKGPFRLILNSGSAKEIEWHCKHYVGRGLMKRMNNVAALAADAGLSQNVIEATFAKYNEAARTKKDDFGRQFFDHAPMRTDDVLHVAVVTPVVHYCMGGLRMSPDSEVVNPNGVAIPGLFAAGEVMGGVHGQNRLGGSSLLDCVVFGRVAGNTATRYQLNQLVQANSTDVALRRAGAVAGQVTGSGVMANVAVDPKTNRLSIEIQWGTNGGSITSSAPQQAFPVPQLSSASPSPPVPKQAPTDKVHTWGEVASHNTEKDCWVVVNGQVLDVTKFLPDHPGGKKAIMLFAGKDATEEFNMLHKPDVVSKYAPDSIIGQIEKGARPQHTLSKL